MDSGSGSGAGWHPDPFGRHQFRWFDGSAWSDQVSNWGSVTTDPLGVAPGAPQAPAAPVASAAPGAATAPSALPPPFRATEPGPTPRKPRRTPLIIGAGIVVIALVAATAFWFFARPGSDDSAANPQPLSKVKSIARQLGCSEDGTSGGMSVDRWTKQIKSAIGKEQYARPRRYMKRFLGLVASLRQSGGLFTENQLDCHGHPVDDFRYFYQGDRVYGVLIEYSINGDDRSAIDALVQQFREAGFRVITDKEHE